MKTHEVIRTINGIRYRCKDTGCSDFDRAVENRYMVANSLFTTMYQQVESYLLHSPLRKPLPEWMPTGELVNVGKEHWREREENVVGG